MTVRPKRPSIRPARAPGHQVRHAHVPETPVQPTGRPEDHPPTYDELMRFKVRSEDKLREYVEFLCEIYDVLDAAKGNNDRVIAIKKVKGAIASLDEVETS